MAEDQVGTRKDHLRDSLIWTRIFTTFRVALDPKKLLLAAAGIVVMSFGWWFLAWVFYSPRSTPDKDRDYPRAGYVERFGEAGADYEREKDFDAAERNYALIKQTAGPGGSLSTWPWFEDRGPNPFQQVERGIIARTRGEPSAERVQLVQSKQFLVLIEPLAKFLAPVIYLFHPDGGGWNRIYFFLVILVTLATWALFGAAITRMAAVQYARNEKIGMTEAVRFAWSRYVAFFSAPLFPLVLIAILTLFLIVFGFFQVITVFIGDIFIAGLLWPLVLLIGLIMAVVLVGLIGWPLMYATISAEGSDSFDALSRSYSYVYQAPWHYLWYSFLAVVYGAVAVFFIGLMGSLMVYLGKWGVSQAPLAKTMNREPDYLFIWAPTSFGWRDLLLEGGPAVYSETDIRNVGNQVYINRIQAGLKDRKATDDAAAEKIDRAIDKEIAQQPTRYVRNKKVEKIDEAARKDIDDGRFASGNVKRKYWDSFSIWNSIGAALVSFWLYLIFLLVVGFGYSYFWCATTIIYLLMRRKVDDTDIDEVHLEEEDTEEPYTPPQTPAATPAGSAKPAGTPGLIPSESLTLRPQPPADASVPAPEPPRVTPVPGPEARPVTMLAPQEPEPPRSEVSTPAPLPNEPAHEPPRRDTGPAAPASPLPPSEHTGGPGPDEPGGTR